MNEMLSQSYPDPAAQAGPMAARVGSGEGRRERLKRLRVEMGGGRVCIPESWGQESRLKDWADCVAFGGSFVAAGAASAREALAEECRKANSSRVELENRC